MIPDTCPPREHLRAFHEGRLAEARLDEMAGHLERCPACDAVLRGWEARTDDPLQAALRQPHPSRDTPRDPAPDPPGAGEDLDAPVPRDPEVRGEPGRGGLVVVDRPRAETGERGNRVAVAADDRTPVRGFTPQPTGVLTPDADRSTVGPPGTALDSATTPAGLRPPRPSVPGRAVPGRPRRVRHDPAARGPTDAR
jgi:hypothetical protein